MVKANSLKFLFLAHGVFAWMFLRYSPGLVFYIDGESIGYVKDLMSSGSDDDVAIWLILFFDLFASDYWLKLPSCGFQKKVVRRAAVCF